MKKDKVKYDTHLAQDDLKKDSGNTGKGVSPKKSSVQLGNDNNLLNIIRLHPDQMFL